MSVYQLTFESFGGTHPVQAYCVAADPAEAAEVFLGEYPHHQGVAAAVKAGQVQPSEPPNCRYCGKPAALSREGVYFDDCEDCQAADHAAECASLEAAESGAGQERVNDWWAERSFGGS